IATLGEEGVGYGIYYPTPIHLQQAYRQLGTAAGAQSAPPLPITEAAADEVLSLPVHPALTAEDLNQIIVAVRKGVCVAQPNGLSAVDAAGPMASLAVVGTQAH
ncbi:MAG: DegT/DnrJ/EryC1/StrS family aminotransferase, partial [Caldilineaceae bacterium]